MLSGPDNSKLFHPGLNHLFFMSISARASTFQTEDGAAMTDYVVWKNLRSFYNRMEDLRKITASNKEGLQENKRMDWVARGLLTGTGFLICLGTIIFKMKGTLKTLQMRRQQNPGHQLATYNNSVASY